ncbi:MAG: sugar ABC transporter permease [Clostridia bacterium]|nr:sugar ABC transporter permease [Clostridia bacterium]
MQKNNGDVAILSIKKESLLKRILKCWQLYVFLIPAVVGMLIFHYYPIYGITLAFKRFMPGRPISQAPWIGFEHFRRFFASPNSMRIIWNTIKISMVSQVLLFPLPLIFALSLNQVQHIRRKKFIQNVTYIPYLFSVVIVMTMAVVLLAPNSGIINILVEKFTGEKILFFGEDKYVLPIYVITGIWAGLGYSAVMYLSALSSVDQEQLEAAKIDGATRLRIIWSIELPALRDTIVILLILQCGHLLSVGVDKMLLIQTDLNRGASDVIGTYAYELGLIKGDFAFSTAISLFNNLANISLLLIVNGIANKLSDNSIF